MSVVPSQMRRMSTPCSENNENECPENDVSYEHLTLLLCVIKLLLDLNSLLQKLHM